MVLGPTDALQPGGIRTGNNNNKIIIPSSSSSRRIPTWLIWMLVTLAIFSLGMLVGTTSSLDRQKQQVFGFEPIIVSVPSDTTARSSNDGNDDDDETKNKIRTGDASHGSSSSLTAMTPSLEEQQKQEDQTPTEKNSRFLRYYEIPSDEFANDRLKPPPTYRTAHEDSTIIERAYPWFQPKRICIDTCCAVSVAVSLDQDDRHIINTLDGIDLGEILVRKYNYNSHRSTSFFGAHLTDDIAPCIQSGTIIHIDNHGDVLAYFFKHFRKNITASYVLVTSESDGDSPWQWGRQLVDDELLLGWFGTSPKIRKIPDNKREEGKQKFYGLPLGLSKHHEQDRYLSRFMELTNFTNPFADKERWTNSDLMTTNWTTADPSLVDEVFYKSVYVRFNPNHSIQSVQAHRRPFHESLCDGYDNITNKLDNLSCSTDQEKVPHDSYVASSRYLFGFSPEGVGFDCYRTYELLLVGVIPIIKFREDLANPGVDQTNGMWDGWPIVQLHQYVNRTRAEYLQVLQEYIASDAFQNNDFQAAWEKLFLRYWRRKMLDLGGRTKDIIVDPNTGKEYYQAWRYIPNPVERYGLTKEEEKSVSR